MQHSFVFSCSYQPMFLVTAQQHCPWLKAISRLRINWLMLLFMKSISRSIIFIMSKIYKRRRVTSIAKVNCMFLGPCYNLYYQHTAQRIQVDTYFCSVLLLTCFLCSLLIILLKVMLVLSYLSLQLQSMTIRKISSLQYGLL